MTLTSNTTALTPDQEQTATGGSVNNRIKKLPPLLVNQLAAGEVVTRPASVVKELIENAIDAGAKNIDIRITQGGMGIIEVADDGCGIHPDDMIMAVTRFATSKIADVAHLQGIATLGFRGEALAATAAVSRLTLTSCSDDSGIGRELNVAGILEDTPQMTPVVHPRGTTVSVRDLYFNVPARRGNLKSISTEYAHIEMVVKQLALVASDISFTLWHNDKRRFNFESIGTEGDSSSNELLTGSEPMKSAMMQSVLARLTALIPTGHDQAELFSDTNLQPVTINLEGLRSQHCYDGNDLEPLNISGFLIPSYRTLSSSTYKLIYINGRLVKDRRIAQSVRESAANLANVNNLGYVLFFNLPKAWLNLNVHPTKQCIKIQNLANVMAHLEVGIRDALQLWQHRQQQLSQSTEQAVAPSDKASIPVKPQAASSAALNTSDQFSLHEPVDSYQFEAKSRATSSASNLIRFNSRQWHLLPESVATADSQGSITNKLQTEANNCNDLKCLGVITNNEIAEGLLQQISTDSIEQLNNEVFLVLIQFNQIIYLLNEKGLQAILEDEENKIPYIDFMTMANDTGSKLDILKAVNAILEPLMSIKDIDYEAIFSEQALTKMTISELFLLMLGSL